jgi:hypothetical protein
MSAILVLGYLDIFPPHKLAVICFSFAFLLGNKKKINRKKKETIAINHWAKKKLALQSLLTFFLYIQDISKKVRRKEEGAVIFFT